MGRIIGYQYDNDIKDDDAWIGTEATSRRTKQYTAQAVADYLNINGSISIVGQMSYKYSTTPLNGIGTFAVFGGGPNTVAFSAITKLTLSNQDISEQRVVEYLDLLVGSDMIISESGQISTFGYYSIDGYVVNATNSDYYDLSVTFKSGNGAMEADKVYETQNFTLAAEENISTLQTTIDSGNTYQASPSGPLWTWGASAITVASTSFTSFLSGKRFKTTFIADGSYTDVLPNQLIFNNALGNETSITPNTALSSNIDLQWPSSSGTVALTTDITDSPWDTVLGGINYADGNVGIGTTSPSAKLEVNGGEIRTTRENVPANYLSLSTTSAGSFIKNAGGTSKGLTFDNVSATSPYINFKLLSSEAMRVTSAGNVGVGTTSPSAPLDVATISSGPVAKFVNTSGTGGAGVVIQAGVATSSSILTLFDYQNNERLRVRGDGNVGIGTASPSQKLQVSGNILATGNITAYGGASDSSVLSTLGTLQLRNSGNTNVNIQSTGNSYLNGGNVGIGTTSPAAKLHITQNTDNLGIRVYGFDDRSAQYAYMHDNGSSAVFGASQNVKMQSGVSGYAFIDSETDVYLDVGSASNDFKFRTQGVGEIFTIKGSGNVGIGTTSPSVKLHVDSASVETIAYFRSTDNRGRISIADNDTTTYVISEGSKMSLGSNASLNAGNLTIDSSGKVGIGTISPAYALDVEGSLNNIAKLTSSATKSQLLFVDSNTTDTVVLGSNGDDFNIRVDNGNINFQTNSGATATTRMLVNSSGNVGIGTTSPTSKLDVAGGDIELDDVAAGIIMRSPDGTKYRITVANGGTLTVTAV